MPLELRRIQLSHNIKTYLLFVFCDKIDRNYRLRLCVIIKVTKHKAYCNYLVVGVLQIINGLENVKYDFHAFIP